MEIWMKRLLGITIMWLFVPIFYGLGYCLRYVTYGHVAEQWFDQSFMANVWSRSGFFWIWVTVCLLGSAIIWFAALYDSDGSYGYGSSRVAHANFGVTAVGGGLLVLCVVLSSVQTWRVLWDNDKDMAKYYAASVTYYTPSSTDAPDSLTRLMKGATAVDDQDCDLVGNSDVPSCIKVGTLPTSGWEPRVGSLDGAKFALTRTSGDTQKVSLNEDTLTYLNARDDHPASWSGVMDGSGKEQAMGGVAEWSGSGNPVSCYFKDAYALDRSFGGERKKSMKDLLAEKFPALRWDISDVWGYCDGEQPIVIVPMTEQVYFKHRTVDTAAGIVKITGENGKTSLKYEPTVKVGEYPGPVYPASLVVKQREESVWSAGRKNMNRYSFGFDPASSSSQAGNVSEYLLRDVASGRLQWVTPLTLRSSSSELFVAYAITNADEVNSGSLNELSIYAMAQKDPRVVNIDNLESQTRSYLSDVEPGFFSAGGKLVEFIPINGDTWRAFGELSGRVKYRIDISAQRTIPTILVDLDKAVEVQGDQSDTEIVNAKCGMPLNELTPSQVAICAQIFVDELAGKVTSK